MSTGRELRIAGQTDPVLSNPNRVPPHEYITDPEYEELLTDTWTGLESANRNRDVVEIVRISEEQAARIIGYWQLRLAQFEAMSSVPISVTPHMTDFGDLENRATWETSYNNESLRLHIDTKAGKNFTATLSRGLSESERNPNEYRISLGESQERIGSDYDGITFIGGQNGISFDSLYLDSLVGGEGKYIFNTKSRIHILNGRIQSIKREERSQGEVDESTVYADFKGEISLSMRDDDQDEYL